MVSDATEMKSLSGRKDLTASNVPFIVPFWELGPMVQSLSLQVGTRSGFLYGQEAQYAETGEISEQDLKVIVSSSSIFADHQMEMHVFAVHRTIAAAARGGKLKRLVLPQGSIQKPFAVRALLPYWIGVEERYIRDYSRFDNMWMSLYERWSTAASTLRPALAHASRWLPRSTPDGFLTRKDVQALHAYFAIQGSLDFTGEEQRIAAHDKIIHYDPIQHPSLAKMDEDTRIVQRSFFDLYLPWLAEDGELAQQVAGTWNAVVQRGQADVVKCRCRLCNEENGYVVKCQCFICSTSSRYLL